MKYKKQEISIEPSRNDQILFKADRELKLKFKSLASGKGETIGKVLRCAISNYVENNGYPDWLTGKKKE